jgi:hypothetical protein
MGAERIVLRSQRISVEEETTEGTPVAETANGAIMTSEDGAEFVLDRDMLEGEMMSGSFTKDAPEPGMWSDDLGFTLPTKMRGIGTLSTHGPDWQMLMKSIMGTELRAEEGVVDAGSTALVVQVKSGCASPAIIAGQLLYFPTQDEVRRIQSYAAPAITLDIPLSSIPAEDDLIKTGVNWMLNSSASHPIFTAYAYFDDNQGHRLRYTSCKTTECELAFEVGGHCDMNFKSVSIAPLYDTTAQAITPNYDQTTEELTCLGVEGFLRVAGTATGVPTTIETILLAPNYDVRVGDSIQIEVSAGVWETKAISDVSGDAGSNITLTHAAVSIAASAADTVYIMRGACADIGEELSIKIEAPVAFEKCMFAASGKTGIANIGRTVSIDSEPYFKGWEQFLMRDNSTGQAMMVSMGDDLLNIVAVYIPKKVNAEVSLTNDDIMKNTVSSRGVNDGVLGDDHELVIAAF